MKKPITIKDLAKSLNISVATVSRALRNSSEINEETKQAVLKLAKEMDYHPNLLARGLSSKKSKILGVVVPTINRQFWSNSISGIENIAYQDGFKVMIFQSAESYQKEVEIVETLANSRVDGILIAFSKETNDYDHVQQVMDRGIPVLLFERVCEALETSKVVTDDFYGAKKITQHLISRGKSNIAYLGGPMSLGVCKDRFLGFQSAMTDAGLEIPNDHILEIEEFTFENAKNGIFQFWNLKNRPDAVFCFADILAIGALDACKELGIKIPQQLAIAGFGNDDTSRFVSPSITTMAQPSFEIGQMAAKLILEEISAGNSPLIFRKEVIQPTLLIREST
ncbi:MAG TPA: LacI family DNA-binding transcriptional regulator [Algoriphagus sp.]|nr:LacI family DNA-binding transcriptional regulator [Algoriphagus sp.]